MDNKEAIKRLTSMLDANAEAVQRVKKKRWRPSEKAMTIADLHQDRDALQRAIRLLEMAEASELIS